MLEQGSDLRLDTFVLPNDRLLRLRRTTTLLPFRLFLFQGSTMLGNRFQYRLVDLLLHMKLTDLVPDTRKYSPNRIRVQRRTVRRDAK